MSYIMTNLSSCKFNVICHSLEDGFHLVKTPASLTPRKGCWVASAVACPRSLTQGDASFYWTSRTGKGLEEWFNLLCQAVNQRQLRQCACIRDLPHLAMQHTPQAMQTRQINMRKSNCLQEEKQWQKRIGRRRREFFFVVVCFPGVCLCPSCMSVYGGRHS